jgi:uncharacterized protein (TIGR03083 family)
MRTRPLRQYYDEVDIVDELGAFDVAWRRHRQRFLDNVGAFTDEQWTGATRCTEWDVRGVVSHLVTVDGFWVFTLGNARAKEPPTKMLVDFNPSISTNDMVGPLMALPSAELLDQFATSTDALAAMVDEFGPADWSSPGESPLGHIPARHLFAHAFWDSWLHERDVFLPAGSPPPADPDEVRTITSFALIFAGLQGGLLDDANAVGPGPERPVDVVLRFAEFPDEPLRVRIDTGVGVTQGDPAAALDAGSAIDLVEALTGRVSLDVLRDLPGDLTAQLARAAQVL